MHGIRARWSGTIESKRTRRSDRLRALVHHALSVLSELQTEAGRLDALAAIRETACPTFFETEE
jgi:hypothetical protein